MRIALIAMVVLSSVLVVSTGCSQPHAPPSSGVLSVIHQKCLTTAAERAMKQADVNDARIAKKRVCLKFDDRDKTNQTNNIGSDHVRTSIREHVHTTAAAVLDDCNGADQTVDCQILMAGVDTATGSLLMISWKETKGEVQLRLACQGENDPATDKQGTGTCIYKQTYLFGISLGDSWK